MPPKDRQIHPDLVEVALDRVEGFAFERFANNFLAAIEGRTFTPLGGVKDGGADAVEMRELHSTDADGVFYQFTVQSNHRDKIRKTIKRLRAFGRTPKALRYLTSRHIPHIDKEEDLLSDELDVRIRISDGRYIASHINDTNGTVSAYQHHLEQYTAFLEKIGQSSLTSTTHINDPTVFVFLQHEVANRLGNRKLVHSITDTLILWALRDTDPDKDILLSREEILDSITATFPWARAFIKNHIHDRLSILRAKSSGGREVRWHKKTDRYCLPFETRENIKQENSEDEALRLGFIKELSLRASELFSGDDGEYELVAHIALGAVEKIFQRQGLILAHFVTDDDENEYPLIASDCIQEIVAEKGVIAAKQSDYCDHAERLVCSLFYNSTQTQRQYLALLARTYVLLFTLQAEPRIIEYFSSMSGSFNLFVGSDILVRALSERYLNEGDQPTRNMLKIAASSGMTLNLSDNVLEEVYTHIRNTNYEFINNFSEVEPYVTRDIVRNSEKILIRAYFYAKFEKKIAGWKKYISQFISHENITTSTGQDELKKYLVNEYNLNFVDKDELESLVDLDKVDNLAHELLENGVKENESLARNSALLVYGVYGLRKKSKESKGGNPYGYSTWWLTNQTRIQRYTVDLVRTNHAKYIMRPEFVLNFMSLAPSCDEIRRTYSNIFPTNLGVELGHRLNEDVFRSVLNKVKEWKGYEPGRVSALISQLSDVLKSDQKKIYEHTMETMDATLRNLK